MSFSQFKQKVEALSQEMGYKVHYYTGPLGEKLQIETPSGGLVRALTVVKDGKTLILFEDRDRIYAVMKENNKALCWDVTDNFGIFKAKNLAEGEFVKQAKKKLGGYGKYIQMVTMLSKKIDLKILIDLFMDTHYDGPNGETLPLAQEIELKEVRL